MKATGWCFQCPRHGTGRTFGSSGVFSHKLQCILNRARPQISITTCTLRLFGVVTILLNLHAISVSWKSQPLFSSRAAFKSQSYLQILKLGWQRIESMREIAAAVPSSTSKTCIVSKSPREKTVTCNPSFVTSVGRRRKDSSGVAITHCKPFPAMSSVRARELTAMLDGWIVVLLDGWINWAWTIYHRYLCQSTATRLEIL